MNISSIFAKIKSTLNGIPKNEQVFFDAKTLYYGHQKITYRGIQSIRCPFDYVIFQMIISEVKPDLIIEVGTNNGGSALYLADLQAIYNIDGEIHSIDINENARENVASNHRIKLFTEGWEKYDMELAKKFKTVLVIEDAAHTYSCSIGAMKKFAPLVTKGSYLIVEDGIVDELGMSKNLEGGPLKAIREFLPSHPEFVVDRRWCDLFGKNATFNVNGYLKRI
jgi:cephalosporin hydroxylase